MPSEICQSLSNEEKENELKKQSIYLLEDDENNRGFEFFVFIDTENEGNRTPFLKELYNIVVNGHETKDFAEPGHKNELKKWLGIDSDDDRLVIPLNWLKIFIEEYPYRLFVVIDEKKWSKDDKSPLNDMPLHSFIKKVICWISKEEFGNIVEKTNCGSNTKFQSFKTWLFMKWINHIVKSVREREGIDFIHFFFNERESKESFYIPDTLPDCFRAKQPDRSSKPDIELTFDCQFNEVEQEKNGLKNKIYIYYERHGDFYKFSNNIWKVYYEDLSSNLVYSENLSGTLSYFNQVYDSRANINEYKAKFFFLRLAEQALLRIGIIDERFQEWWGKLPEARAGSLHQSRINPLYLEDQNDQNYPKAQVKYGQKDFPSHGFYSIIKETGRTDNLFEIYSYPDKKNGIEAASELWPEGQRGFDMVMIHQGILDKWKENDKTKEALTRAILRLKEIVPFVMITSGRGQPENLPHGIKYLGFSGLEACMVGEYFEKLTLMRQVMTCYKKLGGDR